MVTCKIFLCVIYILDSLINYANYNKKNICWYYCNLFNGSFHTDVKIHKENYLTSISRSDRKQIEKFICTQSLDSIKIVWSIAIF